MSTLTKHVSILLFLFLLFLTSVCILRNPSLDSRYGLASRHQVDYDDLYFQDIAHSEKDTMLPWTTVTITTASRRRLIGPGSSPLRCARKCGWCSPCKPVHVSVPPGTPVTTEYNPEAWRCKCGNRLYMPWA
ncbi:uncharacterized protein LOC143631800 isoform X2 [Bidens hawaiensis]|uniref:uncharacterized protein LOC143631800 isoform X2 n=1 Tax=Bidens hawaiensis TaxID=980011 RepID=UPI00404B6A70